MGEWLKRLIERQEALERGVFTHPASTWEEYQRRLGQWIELQHMIDQITGEEQEQERKERDQ